MALGAQIDPNTVIVGDLNTPLIPLDMPYRQNINKEPSELLHTLDQIDTVDIYRVFHPTTRQYILLCISWNFFQNRSHFRTQRNLINSRKSKLHPASYQITME
jgi:hypothetical protein